ncbi:MAG: IS3 family transposase [Mesorhizobium sp.]|uniref:IS3 family transposase n=1 Tax=Mesorhizobium sp. TaxID=1871066 RepID=UPI000FEA44F9|nr:IS3 family transposase [Mesorhizobium sp.]RWP57655.1 MAG: IS3 family transposase [Mesorhizobium sp.]TIW69486.1 MAG: IS3 family transposase [Mesorhizobium sp.]
MRDHRSRGLPVAEGCRLMGIARSTYYDRLEKTSDDTAIVEAIAAICDEFEHYGWRRVRAALRHKSMIVNHKKIRRLMREHDLQPRMRRRFTVTTDSDHNQPILPNLAQDIIPDGPNQLWVADITYVTVVGGFAYVAVVLDAWSRRVVGYAISRSIDARLTLAALAAAVEGRKPPPCVHHSDRGSQGGFNRSLQHQEIGGCNDGSPTRFRSVHSKEARFARTSACLAA